MDGRGNLKLPWNTLAWLNQTAGVRSSGTGAQSDG
jgi:hypothetical protein